MVIRKKEQKHNIILIGFMGSGKTSVGELLARRMSYHFKDTDLLIEQKEQKAINQIFQLRGEDYFRNLETELLQDLEPSLYHTVLSTGGGMPVREQNQKLLKELGFVVYLKTSTETTVNRLRGDQKRPLLQGTNLKDNVEKMLTLRTPIYESTAHKLVITDGKTPDEIATVVMEAYLKYIY